MPTKIKEKSPERKSPTRQKQGISKKNRQRGTEQNITATRKHCKHDLANVSATAGMLNQDAVLQIGRTAK